MDDTDGSRIDREHYLQDAARLAALARTGLPDSAAEPSFDRLARLAARFLGTPVALVSLVDADRQFFKSCFGLPEPWTSRRETPLSHSFCQHVVTTREPLVINDARVDPRVAGNLAITELNVIAYLGIPLTVDGHVIGSFCAIDGKPRSWTEDDVAMLRDLAESVVTEINLRGEHAEIARQRAAAEEARRRLEVTFLSIGDAVIVADIGGAITLMNPVAEALCGWPIAEARGRALAEVFRIVDARSRRPIEDRVARVMADGEAVGLPVPAILIARDGAERPIEDGASPIRDASGAIEGVILVFRDTTEKRRGERALRDARLRLENALSAGAIATWSWDIPDDRVVADPNLARLFSVSPGDAEGGPLASYLRTIHADDVERVSRVIDEAVAAGSSFDEEYRIVQPDGSSRWVVARGTVERDAVGRAMGLSGVLVDVTDRKQAADDLRRSEDRYRTLFDSMDEGFCVIEMISDDRGKTVDYRFLELNPAFEKHTGLRNAHGKCIREMAPDHDDHWFEIYGNVARTGQAIRFESGAKSLEDRYFEVFASRVGEPAESKVAVLFKDITGRKQAEDERERLVEQLRDADHRKDEFLAMLAHELRNPLAAISNGVQLVQTVRRPELLGELREMIQHQVVHLTRLIDDLLDVSRITQGKIELRKESVDLATVVGRAVAMVRPVVEQKRHHLTVELPDGPVRFVADPTRAEQILGNLLTNAAKYSEPGGSIDLSAVIVGEEIVFRVRDTGVGIAAEMLPKVFGLFTQVDATLDRSQGGLGIGLTLVRNLVEMHGGHVSAASEGKGKGSEFTVTLPIGRPEAEAPEPIRDATAPKNGTGRVLVVDDNVDTARLTARMLRHHGYEVEVAHDGHAAIDQARLFRPGVVLLDIGLPGMNGYEVAGLLRHEDCCQAARMIAISGYGEEQARERSREAGFLHHLTKPLDFGQLISLLQD